MRRLMFWMVFLLVGQVAWAQKDSTVKLNDKPWIVVKQMDPRAGDIIGKLVALEETSMVLIKNPASREPSAYHHIPVSSIDNFRVQGKASLIPRFLLGAFLGGASFYALSQALDQSGRPEAAGQSAIPGALIGGALGMVVFQFRDFNLRIAINGRQDLYEVNKPGMGKWVLE